MTPHELADFAAQLCAWASLAAVAVILVIFGLYRLEDWLNRKDDQ